MGSRCDMIGADKRMAIRESSGTFRGHGSATTLSCPFLFAPDF